MYNNVDIKFLPQGWEKGFNLKEKKILNCFDDIFLKNKKSGCKKIRDGVYRLKIINERQDFTAIFEYLKKIKKISDFSISTYTKYETEDFNRASAYLLRFEKKYEYYDGWNEEKFNSFQMVCKSDDINENACKTWDHTNTIYVKPQGGIKKSFEGFCGATNYEFSKDSIISDTLQKYLTENNVDEKFFKPVLQKNGMRWAYFLEGENSVIESCSLKNDYYIRASKCPKCGRNVCKPNDVMMDRFANDFGEQIVIGNPNVISRWTMDKHALSQLKPVNRSNDYFGTVRLTVINKELFQLIESQIPSVIKNTIPIFLSE